MYDEQPLVARVESANTEELVHILTRPSADEEKALRVYFGDERYARLHSQALKRGLSRALEQERYNVVVIPGFMGSNLTAFDQKDVPDPIWVNVLRIISGGLDLLRLDDEGRAEFNPDRPVRATGIYKRAYAELLLSLSERWNVQAFWYDWRKDLNLAAAALEAQIRAWFGDAPVHIVSHSLGGLVARTFVKNYPKRWQSMWDKASRGKRGGRLIMLGTPNHGAVKAIQAVTGLDSMIQKLVVVDLLHDRQQVLDILHSFVSLYQILPSPLANPSMAPLYQADIYANQTIPQQHLDRALKHHRLLRDAVDVQRMIYIAGSNQPTIGNIRNLSKLGSPDAYEITLLGDGTVTHESGRLQEPDGNRRPIPTYYIEESHGNLVSNRMVIAALQDLLETGNTGELSMQVPAESRARGTRPGQAELQQQIAAAQERDVSRLSTFARQISARGGTVTPGTRISSEQRKLEQVLIREYLGSPDDESSPSMPDVPFPPAEIEITLVPGDITDINDPDVDAIAVGHYVGVRPTGSELALDRAISSHKEGKSSRKNPPRQEDCILTQFTERGILHGDLGQPFFFNDPRPVQGRPAAQGPRIIALVGLGQPSRCGAPELAVATRELCWSLGRMGKRHLAAPLIGAGANNLPVPDAMSAWIRGIKNALTGSTQDENRRLRRITFVVRDALKLEPIQQVILEEQKRLGEQSRLTIKYTPIPQDVLDKLEQKALEQALARFKAAAKTKKSSEDDGRDAAPIRITVSLDEDTYYFGALTETASIPEREIPLDPKLVQRANDELVAAWGRSDQVSRGQFLERLLIPVDFQAQLSTPAPLVMMLDSTMARIHWEMLVQGELPAAAQGALQTGAQAESTLSENFLGISRGFTRQLLTTFAPPPEPLPPARRIMRVLVVADPAEDAHLPGAEEEGVQVADLFESFNRAYEYTENRIEVVRLFGPNEATRTNVLRRLMLHSFDVLHFAGHCSYAEDDPDSTGWLFTKGERLTANELKRIDRIPRFVFSNACESGITPDRSGDRSAGLAPTFAEQFFERGVANFVCTAWPVNDAAAREFALALYGGLLGLTRRDAPGNPYGPAPLRCMHQAMRRARLAIFNDSEDIRTWGAYQHYGNPYLRFFDAAAMQPEKGSQRRLRASSSLTATH